MARIKPQAKAFLIIVAVTTTLFALRTAAGHGWIPTPGIMRAIVPQKAALPEVKDAQVANVAPVALPESGHASVPATLIRGAIWEWNAQMGLIYANGGAKTSRGSIAEKYGVNLQLYRQDDTGKMQEDLIACAREIAGGAAQCSSGANFVVIMGDGSGQFAAAVNPQLKKLGPEYQVRVIGAVGYSRGEDAFMAPPEVKRDPQAFRSANMPGAHDAQGGELKGLLVAGVLRDGDWNIALKWAGDNSIKNNPDETTFDPDAINWSNASDYNVAAADYVAGKCSDRKLVRDGRFTGQTVHACINGVVTWTPGDVTIAQQKGGLVKVVSSKEYRSQMPSVILGPKAFFERNRAEVEKMLAAIFEGGDQVKAFDQALKKAAQLSAAVYADQDANYWYRYFKGVAETDKQGLAVPLGGSAVNNLADNLILFGLQPGANDNFRSTYTVFAAIAAQQYPKIFKDTPIPDVREVEDRSFLTGAQARMTDGGAAAETTEYASAASGPVVSQRAYRITFRTGSADLLPEGERQLRDLKDSLAITGLFIRIDGYTDNTGDEQRTNLPLSTARASTVRSYLQRVAPANFPASRFAVAGHGSQHAVAPNSTENGRAQNRRVEIALLGQ